MSMTTLEPGPSVAGDREPAPPAGKPLADASMLEDRVPPQFKFSRSAAVLTGAAALLFALLCFQPLWHTDVWGHLAYGRWVGTNGAVPTVEPLMPLCEGVPFVDTAWLSQLVGYGLHQWQGVAALQFAYALLITGSCVLLALGVRRATGSVGWAIASIAAFGVIDYQQLLVIRPQLAGLVCFMLTLLLATAARPIRLWWLAGPGIFALWANLHGSYPMGLALIGCLAVGRAFDVFCRTGRTRALFRDGPLRRLVLLGELSMAAVLLTPYGLEGVLEVFRVAANTNVQDLLDWLPLTLKMKQGKAAAAALVALFVIYRWSPRRVSSGEALALVVFGLGACWSSRILMWWGPLAAYWGCIHAAAIRRRPLLAEASPRGGTSTVAVLGILWIAFAYSPLGVRILHGKSETAEQQARRARRAYSQPTPVEATAWLREHPPQGLVYNSYEWGDYLLWAGPPGIQVFAASHAHLIPPEVWQDGLRIASAPDDWRRQIDRYGVTTIVLDSIGHGDLIRRVREQSADWKLVYEDGLAVIFERIKPL